MHINPHMSFNDKCRLLDLDCKRRLIGLTPEERTEYLTLVRLARQK